MADNYIVTIVIPVYNQETLVIRALDSIPNQEEIEVIVIDDGSTDNTWQNLLAYKESNRLPNLVLLYNTENKGVAYTVNRGYDAAQGKYIVNLGSDDYFYTDEFLDVLFTLYDSYDLIYFNLRTNNGDIFKLTKETREEFCGSVKFMRRDFLYNLRCPENVHIGEDWCLMQQLISKNPSELYTDKVVKHYNFPREGSLCDLANKGKL